jgi:hypothetical protein
LDSMSRAIWRYTIRKDTGKRRWILVARDWHLGTSMRTNRTFSLCKCDSIWCKLILTISYIFLFLINRILFSHFCSFPISFAIRSLKGFNWLILHISYLFK